MEIDLFCVAPDYVLIPRIQENSVRYPARVKQVEPHDVPAVIVGGGPSISSRISSIRQRQQHGQKVFALNGAGAYLNAHGIVPDYQVLLDPQEFMAGYFAPAGEYLIASQCHPATLAASPKPPILWHFAMEGCEEIMPPADGGDCLIGGGISVGLTAMCLAYAMGHRQLHLYGYDSSSTPERDHAYDCPQKPGQRFDGAPEITCGIAGKKFRATLQLAKQAQTFMGLCDQLNDHGCLITVDCDGLLRAIVDESNRLNAA